MILKVFGWILGGIILLGGIIFLMPVIQEGVATNNTTWAASNYSATQQAIRFTPVALIIGIAAVPVVCIVIYMWAKRSAG